MIRIRIGQNVRLILLIVLVFSFLQFHYLFSIGGNNKLINDNQDSNLPVSKRLSTTTEATNSTSSTTSYVTNATFESNKISKPVVFVCITGQLSRLELSNKVVTLFRPLQEAGYDLDINLVLTQTNFTNLKRKGGTIQNEFPAVFDSFSSAFDYLAQQGIRSVSNVSTQPVTLPSNIPLNEHYAKTVGEDRTMNHARMYVGCNLCWEKWKQQTNIDTYAFAIRIREDMGFSTPQNIPSMLELLRQNPSNRTVLATDCRHHNGVNDRMAILTTPAAEAYFTEPYRHYLVLNETLIGGSERFLKGIYIKSGINVVATSTIRFVIKLQQNITSRKSELSSSQELVLRCKGGRKKNAQLGEKLMQQLDAVNSLIP